MTKTKTKTLDTSAKSAREVWLRKALQLAAPEFAKAGHDLSPNIRVSVSFPYNAKSAIGQCFPTEQSKDASWELIVHPKLEATTEVLGTLLHEAVHTCVFEDGHGNKFAELGHAIGLEGKPTSMGHGYNEESKARFSERWGKVIEKLGPYPHAALIARHRKQTTRMIKCECVGCGYIARVSSGTLNHYGAPLCPNEDCEDQGERMVERWGRAN